MGAAVMKTYRSRAQVRRFVTALERELPPGCEYHVTGSWRRLSPTVGDLDVVVVRRTGSLEGFKFPASFEPEEGGPKKVMGSLKVGRDSIHVDWWAAGPKEVGGFLLFTTGPQSLTIRQRTMAKKRDLHLNQAGLFRRGLRVDDGTEEGIYRCLGMKWMTPQERDVWAPPGPDAVTVMVKSRSGNGEYPVLIDGPRASCPCRGFTFYRECWHIPQARAQLKAQEARKRRATR